VGSDGARQNSHAARGAPEFELHAVRPELVVLPPNPGRQGLLQISTPTSEEIAASAAVTNVTFDRLNAKVDEHAVA